MKIAKAICRLLVCTTLLCLSVSALEAQVFPYKVQRTTLPNGLKILMIPMPSEGLVAYWSVVRTGSRDEVEEGVTGFAHFFEHVMFRGSEKYPGPVYDNIVTSMGADANAYTTDDYTAYHLSVTRDDLPTVIDIESDRFKNLRYSEDEFKTESGAVYGEFRKGRTSPFSVLFESTQNAAFDKHTYKHTTIGFEKDIEAMPQQYEYSKTFFERFYRPENVVLMVVGDFDPEATLALINKGYGNWKPGYVPPEIPEEPEQTAQRRVDIPFDGQTLPIIAVNFKGDRLKPRDLTMVAATLIPDLAFGETSPLYKKLVLKEQRVQFIQGDFGYNRDPNLWSIFSMVKDPSDVAAVEKEIFKTIASLRTTPVTKERLDNVRSNIRNGFLSSLSTPSRVAGNLARLVAITGDVKVVDEMFSTLANVTPQDIQAAANLYLSKERSTVSHLFTRSQDSGATSSAHPPVLMPVKEDPNIAVKIWFKAGSQNDPPGKEGLAALTASLLTEGGTESNNYETILEKLFPLAASYGASVDKEMTVVTGVVYKESAEQFSPLFLDALLHPGFRADDFERLKSRAISQLEKNLRYSSDEELGKAALYETVFHGTPYQHLDLGTVEGLHNITLEDVKEFYATFYTSSNVTLGLGGSYKTKLKNNLLTSLASLPEGTPESVPAPRPNTIRGRNVVLVEKPGHSTAISMGHPIDVHRGSREFYALWLANSWLGEHRNSVSHLYQVIREARGMNYGDYSYIEAYPNGGRRSMPPTGVGRRQHLFEVWIRPVPHDRAVFALRAGLREVDKLIKNGLTQEQFETQKKFLQKYVYQFATDTTSRLGYAIDDRFYGIEGHLARFRKTMGSLTLEEVNAAIRKHMTTDNMVIAMVTADANKMKIALSSDTVSPIDYGDLKKPDHVMTEDKEIQTYPIKVEERNVTIVPVDQMFQNSRVSG